jgi:dihydroorotase
MHQPRTTEEKEVEFDHALPGISNLYTAFAVANTALGSDGTAALLELLTVRNRMAVGLPVPTIAVGEAANLCLVHPETVWTPHADPSASRNNPWLGKELKGKVLASCYHNHWVFN